MLLLVKGESKNYPHALDKCYSMKVNFIERKKKPLTLNVNYASAVELCDWQDRLRGTVTEKI